MLRDETPFAAISTTSPKGKGSDVGSPLYSMMLVRRAIFYAPSRFSSRSIYRPLATIRLSSVPPP
jgi:hypothetical protein